MAEDLVFARKASGLVRGLDMWDAFGAGLMTCQPISTLWLMVGIALSLYPTGNLLISIAIGAVTAGIGAPLVWGILSGSMPRAGGEYVYNSRILHPAIGGVLILIVALFLSSKADFIHNWNVIAVQYKSLSYEQFIHAAGPLPDSWDWRGTFGAFSGVYALFVYNYAIAYLSGEVKRPDKALLGANIMAVWVPIVLGFLTVIGLYRIMAFNFLSASAAQSFGAGVEGYTAPFSPDYLTLTWIASGRSGIVAWAILLAFIAVIWLEITIAILIVGRAWLALSLIHI